MNWLIGQQKIMHLTSLFVPCISISNIHIYIYEFIFSLVQELFNYHSTKKEILMIEMEIANIHNKNINYL